nr:hypothetical protein [Collinsella tanakaei]
MSVNATNPSTLFGGTWQRIQGRFLFAANSAHAAGTTGGEETHKLTVDEMPAHDHDMYQSNNSSRELGDFLVSSEGYSTSDVVGMASTQGISGSHSFRVGTMSNSGYAQGYRVVTKEGGDKSHNNMPPYLSVYIWKRTA